MTKSAKKKHSKAKKRAKRAKRKQRRESDDRPPGAFRLPPAGKDSKWKANGSGDHSGD